MKRDLSTLEISSVVKYRVMFFSGAVMHCTFLIIFLVTQVYLMMLFNFASVAFYLVSGVLIGTDIIEKHPLSWTSIMYAEVTLHGLLATLITGWDSAFYLYMMVILALAPYMLFITCSEKVFWRTTFIMGGVTCALYFVLIFVLNFHGPLMSVERGELTPTSVVVMRSVNLFFTTGIIFLFTLIFILEISALIRKLNLTNAQLEYTASHDALTGLYNRNSLRGFLTQLKESNESYCVAMGDLDDFKKINDTYGHDCGDAVLRSVAEVIVTMTGERDLACRWGGEEMLIIMYGTREECLSLITGLKEQINSLGIESGGKPVKVSMTFGFADYTEDGEDNIERLISLVDSRLYIGKKSGKNVVISQ